MTHKKFPRVRRGVYDLSLEGPDRRRSGGSRGGKRQIRTNFSEICVSSKSEGKSLTALEYDTIWFGARLMCEIYPSLQFKNMPQILSLFSFWENYTYQHSTRSEGILCMARVKGRRASSNHHGCSLREPNEAKHAKLISNNNILSIVWKTDV